MKQYFAGNLKKLRKNADITQEKLAECLGVLPQTVSKWERAETYPDIETLPSLANFFGVTIDELLSCLRINGILRLGSLQLLLQQTDRPLYEPPEIGMTSESLNAK